MPAAIGLQTEDGKTYLSGVRPLSWTTGEMCEFGSALTRTLECVGEEVPYHYVMGVTGVAFRFTFGPELWNPGFYGFSGVAADVQDLIRRAFSAIGYEHEWFARGQQAEDLARIRESIDRGVGVMLRGHLVDASDWVFVGGYAHDGQTLYATSTYTPGPTLEGYDAVAGWHDRTKETIILGPECRRPPAPTIYTEALRLAVGLVRSADPYRGLAAYDALAGALREETYAEQGEREEDGMWFRYLCLLCYNMMLDDRQSAAPFLRDAVEVLPHCQDELLRAAACHDRSCELRNSLDSILPGDFSEEAQRRVLDPQVRERYAQVIVQIRDSDSEALDHIEAALARVGA